MDERLSADNVPPLKDIVRGMVRLADEWDQWCQEHCRACYDEEFRKTHSHDCGITRRDVVDRLRSLTRVTPPGETEEETAEWYDTHDAITGAVIPPGQGNADA